MRVDISNLDFSDDSLVLQYQGEPFTGTALEYGGDQCVLEAQYKNGQRSGTSREWSRAGSLLVEESYAFDSLHGVAREWFETGGLKREALYELGICVREKRWQADGSLVSEMVLHEASPQYKTLELLRAGSLGQALALGVAQS